MGAVTFKRFKVVDRVYESDAFTAARVARAYEKWDDHRQLCNQCKYRTETFGIRCWQGEELFNKVKAATEKRYEDYEVTAS